MDALFEDLRSAWRQFAHRPALHLLIVAILAVGIGANAAMFTLADAALFRALPIAEQDRVMRVFIKSERGSDDFSNASLPQVGDLAQFQAFDAYAGYADWVGVYAGKAGQAPERITGGLATGGFFEAIGVQAMQGRTLGPQDDLTVGGHPVVVVSHHYWRTRMASALDAVGAVLQINRVPYTIVGVLPAGFGGLSQSTQVDLWLPMSMAPAAMADGFFTPERMQSRSMSWLDLVVRLKPGVTEQVAQAELDAWAATEAAKRKAQTQSEGNGPWLRLMPANIAAVDPYGTEGTKRNAWLLGGVVGLLLLLAAANVAGLLAVRAEERVREFAVRLGLGASRLRIVRQLLIECAVLAATGMLAGLVFARALLGWIAVEAPDGVIVPLDPANAVLEPRALVAALIATGLSLLLAGLLPAWRAARVEVAPALKAVGSGASAQRARVEARGALVALQVALSVVLLVGAGLLLRAFLATASVQPGFPVAGGAIVTINLGRHGVPDAEQPAAFERLRSAVAALPGVRAAEWANYVPVNSGGMSTSIDAEGSAVKDGPESNVAFIVASPGYRAALGLELLAGRDLSAADVANGVHVAVINRAMAEKFWPGQDAIGKRLKNIGMGQGGALVIGVVSDHRQQSLRQPPRPLLMVGPHEMRSPQMQLLARTDGDPALLLPTIQRTINALEPELPVLRPQTLADRVAASYSEARLFAFLTAGFALLALALAAAGLYGVLAHGLRLRRRELGIRIALGASRAKVAQLVLGQTGRMVGLGLVVGLGAALVSARALEGLLFGVAWRDPLTILGVAALVAVVAALAALAPVRRAAATDPATALREE